MDRWRGERQKVSEAEWEGEQRGLLWTIGGDERRKTLCFCVPSPSSPSRVKAQSFLPGNQGTESRGKARAEF